VTYHGDILCFEFAEGNEVVKYVVVKIKLNLSLCTTKYHAVRTYLVLN